MQLLANKVAVTGDLIELEQNAHLVDRESDTREEDLRMYCVETSLIIHPISSEAQAPQTSSADGGGNINKEDHKGRKERKRNGDRHAKGQ